MTKQTGDKERLSEAFESLTEEHKRQILGIFQALAYAQAAIKAGGHEECGVVAEAFEIFKAGEIEK
ncbi:MAG: hypothetical protein LBG79_09000 [Spirochaetaceae bacterium]|jgi:hypothetical protein|nr:hypothetical protein [Spirochaetaceae bacterium]GMO17431.1 MAG: hypothetical protein Pg6A_03840 [Termitinemataceae bacterium]